MCYDFLISYLSVVHVSSLKWARYSYTPDILKYFFFFFFHFQEDEEWADFEEQKEVDYTGLRIQTLQMR